MVDGTVGNDGGMGGMFRTSPSAELATKTRVSELTRLPTLGAEELAGYCHRR